MTCLISGEDYLKRHSDFRLVGRESALREISSILVRKTSNSVLLVGPSGVGLTALVMGLQAMKRDNPNAPFDILSKRFFWLDVDALFASGDAQQVRATFQDDLALLERTQDSVLVIEDARDLIEAARVSGNSHFVNALTLAVRSKKIQVILEARDGDLEAVLKWHSDIRESYTLMDLKEPEGEHLFQIVRDVADSLTRHHGIDVNDEAVLAAIDLSTKYRNEDMGLSEAQPQRSVTLLDRALSTFRLAAHETPPELAEAQARLQAAAESDRPALQAEVERVERVVRERQSRIADFVVQMKKGEGLIHDYEVKIDAAVKAAKERAEKAGDQPAPAADERPSAMKTFAARISMGAAETDEIADLRRKRAAVADEIARNKASYEVLRNEINRDLVLGKVEVTREFSAISGIAVDTLNKNKFEVLRGLGAVLDRRVFGQDEVRTKVWNAIKTARVGQRKKGKPQASFLFLGPSGVGKTEVAKAVAEALLGSEKALTRLDMAEYQEKHSVAKLIGAPPGYEGFQAGGILTNAMRKNRNRIVLLDEVEKAHPDVFNVLLSVLSDGILTDNLGRTVSFEDAIVILTSNIGQPHLLDGNLDFDEAVKRANRDLEAHFPSELLNRFAGRQNIIWFKRLMGDSIARIVRREFADLDAAYRSHGVSVIVDDDGIPPFCDDHYDVKIGARGMPGYIETNIEPLIVDGILDYPDRGGTFRFNYNRGAKAFDMEFEELANAA